MTPSAAARAAVVELRFDAIGELSQLLGSFARSAEEAAWRRAAATLELHLKGAPRDARRGAGQPEGNSRPEGRRISNSPKASPAALGAISARTAQKNATERRTPSKRKANRRNPSPRPPTPYLG